MIDDILQPARSAESKMRVAGRIRAKSRMWGAVCALLGASILLILSSPITAESRPDTVPTWHLGENLAPMDSFTYQICTDHVIPSISSPCVVVKLEFIDRLYEWKGAVWIVQATFADHDGTYPAWHNAILRMSTDGRFSIASDPHHHLLSSIITRTVFWMGEYANSTDPRDLEIGTHWGSVMSNKLYVMSVDAGEINGMPVELVTAGYHAGQEQSTIQVVDGIPFPIRAEVYRPLAGSVAPQIQYEFQLLDYESQDQTRVLAPAGAQEHDTPIFDVEEMTLFITDVCGIDPATYDADQGIAELCAQTLLLPDLGNYGVDLDLQDWTHDLNLCTGELSDAMCYTGIVTGVGDASILVEGQAVRLSLVRPDSDAALRDAAAAYLASECAPGSWAIVDLDDLQQQDDPELVGAVYCQGDTSANAMLVEQGLASIDPLQCADSEFSAHGWAAYACDA